MKPSSLHVHPLHLLVIAVLLSLASLNTLAGDGHDHGESAPAPSGPALPRFVATSEAFELIGILDGKSLKLYLDRPDDNSPVRNAQIDLEFGSDRLASRTLGEGEFEATLTTEPLAGELPITAIIHVGNDADLLATHLDIPPDVVHRPPASRSLPLPGKALMAAGAAAFVVIFTLLGFRQLRATRTGGEA